MATMFSTIPGRHARREAGADPVLVPHALLRPVAVLILAGGLTAGALSGIASLVSRWG